MTITTTTNNNNNNDKGLVVGAVDIYVGEYAQVSNFAVALQFSSSPPSLLCV